MCIGGISSVHLRILSVLVEYHPCIGGYIMIFVWEVSCMHWRVFSAFQNIISASVAYHHHYCCGTPLMHW